MPAPDNIIEMSAQVILDSLSDGVYVTDTERRIVFWSQSAERITGWSAAEVTGSACWDNILCHVDKEDHPLCGDEYCPLRRAIVTGERSKTPMIIFARGRDGRRIPSEVTVAPVRNARGEIIGAVEVFRDLSHMMGDLERSKKIQRESLKINVPPDRRVHFDTRYSPRDILGGDYFAIERLDANRYAFLVADVMGHGIASALYTMFLRTLWDEYRSLLAFPLDWLREINRRLHPLVLGERAFVTGALITFDASSGQLQTFGAGHPDPLVFHPDGQAQALNASGLPLGMAEELQIEKSETALHPGDRLLVYTDGATSARDSRENELGIEGFMRLLKSLEYGRKPVSLSAIEKALLLYTNQIRLEDDLALLEMEYIAHDK